MHPDKSNMVIRYESSKEECPLCVAMEGVDPTDGGKEAILIAESEKNKAERELASVKALCDEKTIEARDEKKRADAAEDIKGSLEVKLKKAEAALADAGESDKDGLIVRLRDEIVEIAKDRDGLYENHTETVNELEATKNTLTDFQKAHAETLENMKAKEEENATLRDEAEAHKQDCEEKNALITDLKEKLEEFEKAATSPDTE